MVQRTLLVFDARSEGAELFAHLRANPILGPDATREKNARHVRDVLARAVKGKPKWWIHALPEDDPLRIVADWLIAFDRLAGERSKPDPDPAMIAMHAEDCGRLQERLFWRAGADPETGERREALAVQGRGSRKGSRKGHEKTHGTEDQKRERWRSIAAAFEAEYARLGGGRRKVAAYDIVAERFGVDRSTVIRSLRKNL
jgi:hypothetical protein